MIEGKFKTKDIRIVWYNEHANEKVEYLIYVVSLDVMIFPSILSKFIYS